MSNLEQSMNKVRETFASIEQEIKQLGLTLKNEPYLFEGRWEEWGMKPEADPFIRIYRENKNGRVFSGDLRLGQLKPYNIDQCRKSLSIKSNMKEYATFEEDINKLKRWGEKTVLIEKLQREISFAREVYDNEKEQLEIPIEEQLKTEETLFSAYLKLKEMGVENANLFMNEDRVLILELPYKVSWNRSLNITISDFALKEETLTELVEIGAFKERFGDILSANQFEDLMKSLNIIRNEWVFTPEYEEFQKAYQEEKDAYMEIGKER